MRVRLLGEAGRLFTRELDLDVRTPAEALHALRCQFPLWDGFLMESDRRGIRWRVVTEDPHGLTEAQLFEPCSQRLVIAPIVAGRGDDVGALLAGAALLAAGIGFNVSFLVRIGLAFIFQGLAQLLSPTPQKPADRRQSFLYSGTEYGSTEQGQTVPVLFGETMIRTPPVLSYGVTLDRGGLGTAIVCTAITVPTYAAPPPSWVTFPYPPSFWFGSTGNVWNETVLTMLFPVDGIYRFRSTSDDDHTIAINGTSIVSDTNGVAGPASEVSQYYSMGYYTMTVRARNTGGFAYMGLWIDVTRNDTNGDAITFFNMGSFEVRPGA